MQCKAAARALTWAMIVQGAGACCKGTGPDPTFVDSSEYYVTSISPNIGTLSGGARVVIKGGGFNVNFFTSGNYVFIGSNTRGWVPCDVIEGACTVQCGGPNTLVCDTNPWPGGALSDSGWLDVKVMVEQLEFGGTFVEMVLPNAYLYRNIADLKVPMLTGVAPHAGSSEDAITLTGSNLGYWIQDYRLVYVGVGRAPQGGNVNNQKTAEDGTLLGVANLAKVTTHALCRCADSRR